MSKIKLILVDDELISRNTIKNFLKDNISYEVVADFSDGKSALAWMRENDADILICDMQMPEITGVELMRLVHLVNEFMPVIAISGFDNFDYVRGSLINGAANYLLKHELTQNGLIEVLNQVRDKYRIVTREHNFCRRTGYCIYDKKKFTGDNIKKLVEEGKIAFECANIVPLALSPDYYLTENIMPSEYKQGIVSAITDILAQILGQEIPYLIYITYDYHLVILLSFYQMRSNLYMINTLKNFINRMQRQIIRMLDITCTLVAGNIHLNLEKAVEEGLDMEKCLRDKLYLGGNRVLSFAVNSRLKYTEEELPQELWKQMVYELDEHISDGVDIIKEILTTMEEHRYSIEKVRENCRKILRILGIQGDELKKQENLIGEYEIFEEFRSKLLEMCYNRNLTYNPEQKGYSAMVTHAVQYIERNYDCEISLETCAQEIECSYTYLSRAFKQETGMRFIEYLNQCRLKKAKSLLIRNIFPMKEIVEKSGFRNYNYFFKVFKENEGITPSEFAAKN